jgi:tetratricopeptide (TPR) repeat protein
MTSTRPNFLTLLAPLVTFACGLALFLALNHAGDAGPTASTTSLGAEGYATLGDGYLQKARENGDPGYYSRAERSYDAALRRDPRNVSAVLGAGTLAGLRHEFREQLRLGHEAQRFDAGLAALPVIADAQVELGRYGAAVRTVQRLLDVKPNLTSYARASYLRELSGDTAGAIDAMRLAASAGGAPENVAYVETLRGDLELQRGRVGAARRAYISALRSLPAYPGGMVGLARADAAGGELGRAAIRLRRAAQRLPLTSTLNLLGQVEGALGHQAAAAAALDTARAQQRLYRAAATAPDAEAVLFEADHGSPADAVALGRRVWRAAPSVRSADALGWALTRAGRPAAGYRFATRAVSLGSRDAMFRLHAGIAASRAALPSAAAKHLAIASAGRAALGPEALALLEEAER